MPPCPQGTCASPFPKQPTTPALKFGNSYCSSFYVRIRFRDQLGIIQSVGKVFAESGVSIYNLLQVCHQSSSLSAQEYIWMISVWLQTCALVRMLGALLFVLVDALISVWSHTCALVRVLRVLAALLYVLGDPLLDAGLRCASRQTPIKDRNDSQFVITTDPVDVSRIKAACVALEATDWCLGDTFYMPVL